MTHFGCTSENSTVAEQPSSPVGNAAPGSPPTAESAAPTAAAQPKPNVNLAEKSRDPDAESSVPKMAGNSTGTGQGGVKADDTEQV